MDTGDTPPTAAVGAAAPEGWAAAPRGARLLALGAAVVAGVVAVPYDVGFASAVLWHDDWASPRTALVAAAVTATALGAGAGALVSRPLARVLLLAAAAGVCCVWGVLGIFSSGLPLLLAGGLAGAALVGALRGTALRRGVPLALAATGLTAGASVLAVAATEPPLVRCTRTGAVVSASAGLLRGSGSGHVASSASVSAAGSVATGTVTQDGVTTHVRCEDGRLVELRRE